MEYLRADTLEVEKLTSDILAPTLSQANKTVHLTNEDEWLHIIDAVVNFTFKLT